MEESVVTHEDRGLVNFVKTHLQFAYLYGGTTTQNPTYSG